MVSWLGCFFPARCWLVLPLDGAVAEWQQQPSALQGARRSDDDEQKQERRTNHSPCRPRPPHQSYWAHSITDWLGAVRPVALVGSVGFGLGQQRSGMLVDSRTARK